MTSTSINLNLVNSVTGGRRGDEFMEVFNLLADKAGQEIPGLRTYCADIQVWSNSETELGSKADEPGFMIVIEGGVKNEDKAWGWASFGMKFSFPKCEFDLRGNDERSARALDLAFTDFVDFVKTSSLKKANTCNGKLPAGWGAFSVDSEGAAECWARRTGNAVPGTALARYQAIHSGTAWRFGNL